MPKRPFKKRMPSKPIIKKGASSGQQKTKNKASAKHSVAGNGRQAGVRKGTHTANRPAPRATAGGTKASKPPSGKWGLAEQLRQAKHGAIDRGQHLVINALAGCGKSTTIVEGVKRVLGRPSSIEPSPQQAAIWQFMQQSKGYVHTVCVVAFNKAIAEELKTRLPGCDAKTLHGLGNSACFRAYGRVESNKRRVQNLLGSELGVEDMMTLRRLRPVLVNGVEELVGLCKQNLLNPERKGFEQQLIDLIMHHGLELEEEAEEVLRLTPVILERCKYPDRDGAIDFDDMVWLPCVHKLPVAKYDMLLVDEAQDLNRCQHELCYMSGRRIVMCGDPHQAIYGFAGADADSMQRMKEHLAGMERGAVQLPLTVTRRCGKAIVQEARRFVPEFEAHESAPEGKVSYAKYPTFTSSPAEDYRGAVRDGDMIICRTNAPLVQHCFKFLRAGRKAYIRGRQVGERLLRLVEKLEATDVLDLIKKLGEWHTLERRKEEARKDADEARLMELDDRYQCLLCFCEGLAEVEHVRVKIDTLFNDDNTAGIQFCSAHRSKGLESDRVFILMPADAPMPHPMAKMEWQIQQEYNLLYVAITRARLELTYVVEERKGDRN